MKLKLYVILAVVLAIGLYAVVPPYFWPLAEEYLGVEAVMFILGYMS